jgi:hypothetical protein
MLTVFPMASASLNKGGYPDLSLLVSHGGGKRPYLADYKQLTDLSYLYAQSKNIVLKSFLLQGIISGNKYTKHMEREIAASERGEYIEAFDEEKAKKEFVKECKVLLIRNTWNFVARKFYERIFVCSLDVRLADRLTKDMFRSQLRKLQKFSPSEAASRSFFTGLYSGLLPALALFTVDCGYGLYDVYLKQTRAGRRAVGVRGQVGWALRWALRRLGLHGCVALCSAAGVACGARCNWMPKYSTLLIVAACEAVGGELYNVSLGAVICSV